MSHKKITLTYKDISNLSIKFLNASEGKSMVKNAFDTRRINQDTTRNPRKSAQFYVRSSPFISEATQEKINKFAKLLDVLESIKKDYEGDPSYLESYAKSMYDHTTRILRVGINDGDYSEDQLRYLEQILDSRYRISLAQIDELDSFQLKTAIISKDEKLMKRGLIRNNIVKNYDSNIQAKPEQEVNLGSTAAVGITKAVKPESSAGELTSLFGIPRLIHDTEKSAQRTITITIKDETE